jgi:hypothetical protein
LISFINFHRTFQTGKGIDWFEAIKTSNAGEYFSPKIKVGQSRFGRGLFATQDIEIG